MIELPLARRGAAAEHPTLRLAQCVEAADQSHPRIHAIAVAPRYDAVSGRLRAVVERREERTGSTVLADRLTAGRLTLDRAQAAVGSNRPIDLVMWATAADIDDVRLVEALHHDIVRPSRLVLQLPPADLRHASPKGLAMVIGTGARLAVAGFGSADADLAILWQVPVAMAVFDRSGSQGVTADVVMRTIASSVIDVAHALDLEVVAAGLESGPDADVFRHLGVDALEYADWHRDDAMFDDRLDEHQADELVDIDGSAGCVTGLRDRARRALADRRTVVVIGDPRLQRMLTEPLRDEIDPAAEIIVWDADAVLDAVLVDGWPDQDRLRELVGWIVAAAGSHAQLFVGLVDRLFDQGAFEAAIALDARLHEELRAHSFTTTCVAYRSMLAPGQRRRLDAQHRVVVTPMPVATTIGFPLDRIAI